MTEEAGRSALVVPVPDVEPVVGPWRERFDPGAPLGVPAHVTVGYPFLPLAAVTPEVVEDLATLVAAEPALRVTFARCGRFPEVLWLDPEPAAPFVRLTRALVARWPEAPPYGGRFGDDVTPHLTVVMTTSGPDMDSVERALVPALPLTTVLTEAVLLGFDGLRWSVRHRFAFGG